MSTLATPLRQKYLALALGLAIVSSSSASAAELSPWQVRAGISLIAPKADNGTLLPGNITVDNKLGPTINVAYFLSPHWAVDVLGGLPVKHEFSINGNKAGSTKHLPPVVTLQYHFAPEASIRPYAGIGANYTIFLDEKVAGGGKLKLEDSFGLAAQIGVDIPVTQKVSLGADVRYADIDSKASVNGVSIGKVEIDPLVYSLTAAYRF